MIDVLLSIPLLSYVFFPTKGASVSTSVNLIFIYMTWSSLVFSHHPLEIHLSGLLVLRVIFWLIPSLVFLLFDIGVPSLAEGLKHGGRSSLPPRNVRKLAKLLGLAVLNIFLCMAVEAIVTMAYTLVFKRHIFKMTSTLPLPWTITKHCTFILMTREVLQYYLHRRVLHGKSGLARKHVAYAHATSGAPYSLQVYTDHPIAIFFHRFLPVFLPSVIIRTHMLTYFFVIILTTIEETLAMSGYTFIPGVIMSGITARTAIHYAGRGSSNYGAVGVMDWAHGTSKSRDVLRDAKKEADKRNVHERSTKKAGVGSAAVKDGVKSLKKRVKLSK
ncbi:hypothetical protein E4U13_001144 [Claviceps humidiphila]|uniref:Fatty acid hydroxylase domain-containing protein n=1 Tax=Claviceps humidiphila TaxID=1294629 RepID=A0A9P7TU18_9HYPO|nr:hypothetical protein E4U13_001144 [Claviceps humidiphila]